MLVSAGHCEDPIYYLTGDILLSSQWKAVWMLNLLNLTGAL